MKFYRFSPIKNKEWLVKAVVSECHTKTAGSGDTVYNISYRINLKEYHEPTSKDSTIG